jgi:hypothetical protein
MQLENISMHMQIIIYDETQDYEVDKINLSNYDIEDDPEAVIDIIRDIIQEYEQEVDQL